MYNFVSLSKKNIIYLEYLNKLKDKFNLLNKDFFGIYNNANFMQQILLKRKVKILQYGTKYIGYIWVEATKQNTFNILSMYIDQDENLLSSFRAMLSCCNKNSIYNYRCINNKYNFKVLKATGFKQNEGTLVMFFDLNKYTLISTKFENISFTQLKTGKEEKDRCYIQNEVFKTKERTPLRVEDILYDEMQDYYFKEGSLFVKKDDKYIGYGQIILENSIPYLVNIGILDEYRNRGYCKMLIYSLLNILKNKFYSKVYLKVDVKNKVAINLYKNLGFSIKNEICEWQLRT